MKDTCSCIHYIANNGVQLKPCRFICEIFLRGETNPDCSYILWGVVFGFRITNEINDVNYNTKYGKIKDNVLREIITKTLLSELDQDIISKVIRGGCTFSRRVYDHKVRLNAGFREDIQQWITFSEHFNGKALILGKFAEFKSIYNDASKAGYGAIYNNDWLAGSFLQVSGINERNLGHHLDIPDNYISSEHINVQEMWAVLAAAKK